MKISQRFSLKGMSTAEMLVATAVTSVLAAGLLTGITTLQRSFQAGYSHTKCQIEQTRLLNYISRDLRRALTVKVDQFGSSQRLTLTIPDYYDANGIPREPIINNGAIDYGEVGAPVTPVVISYYKSGTNMFRSVKGVVTVLASGVEDFEPVYTDNGKQSIGISVSFIPKFQLTPDNVGALRAGTATYATTLLRNKRHD